MNRLSKLCSTAIIFTLIQAPAARAAETSEEALPVKAMQELGFDENTEFPLTVLTESDLPEVPAEALIEQPEITLGALAANGDPTRIQIVGRGIQNKKTGDSIALGCVDEACSQIRTVYFTAKTREATFFGQTFFVDKKGATATRKEIKKTVKQINHAYKIYRRNDPAVQERKAKGLGIAGLCLIFCGFIGPLAITKGAIATAAWGISLWGGSMAFVGIAYLLIMNKPLLSKSGMVSTVFADQNGWNWGDRPKRVSEFTFNLFNRFAESGQR